MEEVLSALIALLAADGALTALLAPSPSVSICSYLVPDGTPYPIVLINPGGQADVYNFSTEAWIPGFVDIEVQAQDSATSSAQATADAIQRRIFTLLQDQESSLVMTGYTGLNVRRKRSLPGGFEVLSSGEKYYRSCYEWTVDIAPS